ncbi:LacI family DNA-binding transcriptional regulator [Flavimaricola marinus]|uniref:Lac repressor n=1 Tax=Flavimaricola marinus TaxID=1819565 RepID=A0A238LHV7_9RHOB|nr:LacI family DNA-binding transcriptional regulator [Flavimaricola marinus]SMY08470.1 lac repressor [Flavimaricola marinus]
MTHRFPIKEIARQAGLGTATVDRALNGRAHVSPQTRARVAAAMAELEGQEAQLAARGRRMFFDFVIEAPDRFGREVRRAAERVLPQIGAAVCRPRFVMQEIMSEPEVVAALARIAKRGSHGVCLKARDLPGIRRAVDALVAAGIPVVTLVTDVTTEGRFAHVGLDNDSAGRTAAYLMVQSLRGAAGAVLATRSNESFLGEKAREQAFTLALARRCPRLRIVPVSGGSGVPYETARLIAEVAGQVPDLRAVYSMGGGNRAILQVLAEHGIAPEVYVAHDLDVENRALIAEGAVSFVLHHDLTADMANVFQAFLHWHRLVPEMPGPLLSPVQVITPENLS